jgi:hypothetical protein
MTVEKAQLVRAVLLAVNSQSGRRYKIDWAALDVPSLREVQRLMRDLQDEKLLAVGRAQMMPWRRP